MKTIDNRFERSAPSNLKVIEAFEAATGFQLPASYKEFLLQSNGGEGFVGDDGYLILWSVESLASTRHECGFDTYLPSYLPIGSDGGGEALAIRFRGNDAVFGFVPFGDASEKSFLPISPDFWRTIELIGAGQGFDQVEKNNGSEDFG